MRRPTLIAVLVLLAALTITASDAFAADWVSLSWAADLWDRGIAWMFAQQRLFHRQLASQLSAFDAIGSSAAAWTMATVSFFYGVFHAAGPGHGKAVIATYLLTHESHVRRGIGLAVASAFCQGLVAVLLVGGLVLVAGWLPIGTKAAVNWSERLSFVLLAGMGAYFAFRAAAGLIRAWRPPAGAAIAGHSHDHHHTHGHDHAGHDPHDPSCGVSHGPTRQQIEQARGLRATIGILLSVGLRPCSGAVLVLVLANAIGLVWAGIMSVAAMSAGTAITVAFLALLTVKARHWTAALFGGTPRRHPWLGGAVALCGGVVLFLFGASLLLESLGPAHPLML